MDQLLLYLLIFFVFSDHLSACNCFDIARKSSVLVNRGNFKGYENNIINVFIQSIIKITIYSIAMGFKKTPIFH